jgi:hypothetical protein
MNPKAVTDATTDAFFGSHSVARKDVTFEVPPGLARHAQLVAEFVAWTPPAMDRGADGAHRVTVSLPIGTSWRYQFILDGETVVNDPNASWFTPGPNSGFVSALRV